MAVDSCYTCQHFDKKCWKGKFTSKCNKYKKEAKK